MALANRSPRVVLLLAGLVAGMSGCQQLKSKVLPNLAPKAPMASQALPGEGQPWSGPPSAQQKADIQVAVARSLEKQGEVDRAIEIYLDAVKKDDGQIAAYHRLAVLHDRKGDCKAAEGFYRRALAKEPDNPQLLCDYGYNCYLQRRWAEAESNLRKAIALAPDLARAHNNLALVLARTGTEAEALHEFQQAGCREGQARTNLGFAFMSESRWDDARRQFQLALQADPTSTAAQDGLTTLQAVASNPGSGIPGRRRS